MKRRTVATLVVLALCVCSVLTLTACGKDSKKSTDKQNEKSEKQTTAAETTAETTAATTAAEKKAMTDADISGSDAIKLILSYSNEELELDNKDNYSFLVNNEAFSLDGEDYVEVLASVKTENEDGTYNIEMKKSYYIRFDGKKVFRLDGTDYIDITK